jgi:hypothetical protein
MWQVYMPYKITHRKDGWYVYNPETKKVYSKTGMTKATAMKQRIAIILSEHRGVKDVSKYFA